MNGVSCERVADRLGLDREQVMAAKQFLASAKSCPPPEVCAGVASLDPGLTDDDIAEMFGRSSKWAKMARERREEFCQELGVTLSFEPWVMQGDPKPWEIWEPGRKSKRRTSLKKLRFCVERTPDLGQCSSTYGATPS